ncbi:hypothetical protein GGS20DRAFT_578380 [Poronia punctata]|nr:hypothetical protein GGS20DRAFT_578380 [Poronia punctata]
MDPKRRDEYHAYFLSSPPTAYMQWPNAQNQHQHQHHNGATTGVTDATTARHLEPMVSPDSAAPSRSISYVSDSSLARRNSSAFYSPQSINAPSVDSPPIQQNYTAYSPYTSMGPSPVTRSNTVAGTVSSLTSGETEQLFSAASTPSTGRPPPAVADVNARGSGTLMPPHPEAESMPMSAIYNQQLSPRTMTSEDEPDSDSTQPTPAECYSRRDVHIKRWSWLYVTLILLSVYSTILSGLWLIVSIVQPRYGRGISTGAGWKLDPSGATLVATLVARTIELSFVTVFVAVLGQVLTRRAFSMRSKGVTLAELAMRNWVIQPGSLITHWEGLPHAGTSLLGALTLTATICSLLYTTASDAMVSPKLNMQDWQSVELKGLVKTSYANPFYVGENCQSPLRTVDPLNWNYSCLDVLFSGQSYHSLITYLTEWDDINKRGNETLLHIEDRPTAKHNLFDNTTMEAMWIETEYSDMKTSIEKHGRVVNNVTLAMPHPGVYAAATDPINNILQPNDLRGLGEYSIEASVASPAVNVMCVNLDKEEVSPLIYTEWPNARTNNTDIPGQKIGVLDWQNDIPVASPKEWLNRTAVDDIFLWGEKYGRRPPTFQLFPIDHNAVTFKDKEYLDPLYLLAKSSSINDYTLCEMRSWITTKCSTVFRLSGLSGGKMQAQCSTSSSSSSSSSSDSPYSYENVHPSSPKDPYIPVPSSDWRNLADEWQLAINLNGGAQNNNASNARMLTNMIVSSSSSSSPENSLVPSIAEALAVLATSTLVAGSMDTTFKHSWTHSQNILSDGGEYEPLLARLKTQEYASAHSETWQAVLFYPVLSLVFILNVLCLSYLIFGTALTTPPSRKGTFSSRFRNQNQNRNRNDETGEEKGTGKIADGLVTDYTEPQNLFCLAINSPPSRAIAGSCGHGPEGGEELKVSWRVRYSPANNHYYFESSGDCGRSSGVDFEDDEGNGGLYGKSYKRLSSRAAWL